MRKSLERPPVAANDKLCIRCSLAPVCLPEEERVVDDPEWEPVRLFPPDRDVKTIHITGPGTHISRSGDTLKIVETDGQSHDYPVHDIGALIIHGYPQITTQALHFCARNDIAVHWLSPGGNYVAGLAAGAGMVQRKLRQYKTLSDPTKCLELARKLAMAKVESSLRYLLRATQSIDRKTVGIQEPLQTMRSALRQMARVETPDELRGYEGNAGRAYFSVLPFLLRNDAPEEMHFAGRNRQPPKDRFNAILGFGYALLYQAVLQAVIAVGLEPALGFYHTPRSSAHPLVLDLMELFRVPLWDMVIIGSVNRSQWDVVHDFDISPGRVWLSAQGRKKAIELFEKRLEETWRHPVVDYSLSYSRLIELEARLLEKEWTGQPGLFARMRLR